jgi:hypothetical protein
MKNEQIIEGELADDPKNKETNEKKEVAVVPEQQSNLIIGENSVERASKVATALKDVVERQHLYAVIQEKKYVMVEGWNTLGALMGVFPEVMSVEKLPSRTVKLFQVQVTKWNNWKKEEYTVVTLMNPAFFEPTNPKMKKLADVDFTEIAYKATVRLKTSKGDDISKAEAFCSNLEESKMKNDEYAINSMAQTRATGKAFRLAFSWIMSMAGYEATPAEEIPRDGFENANQTPPPPRQAYQPRQNTAPKQNDDPKYVPVDNNPPARPAQPWKKWENGRSGDRPANNNAQPSGELLCQDCMATITTAEDGYSRRIFGKPLCRKCQASNKRI